MAQPCQKAVTEPKGQLKALSQSASGALKALIEAFRKRDRHGATRVALEVYGIDEHEMETALGH